MQHELFNSRVHFGMASGAIIEITKGEVEPDALSKKTVNGVKWAIWGKDNNYPQRLIDQNMQETTSAGALDFKIKAHFGKGLYFYRETISNGKFIETPILVSELPADMQEFVYRNDLNNFQYSIVQNYEWFGQYLVQYITNQRYNKIINVHSHKVAWHRKAKRDPIKGEIPNIFLSSTWPKPQEGEYKTLEPFDKYYPFERAKGVYVHGYESIDKDYYPIPYWQSNMRWMEVAMKIPRWILANINNSINIKYHIEVPEEYFLRLHPLDKYSGDKTKQLSAIKAEEASLREDMDNYLAGSDNASKTFYSKFAVDPVTKQPMPGWKITPLTNDIKDTAWLNADATAAARISSAHGVNASLTSLVTGSNLNSGSGSDTREKFNVHMQLHTVLPRQKTLEWFDIVSRANRWPQEYKIGFRNITMEELADAKTGYKIQHEQSPTSN